MTGANGRRTEGDPKVIGTWMARMQVRLLLLVLAAATPSLVIIVNAGLEQRREAVEEVERLAVHAARELAARQRELIDHARNLLEGLATVPEIGAADVPDKCRTSLARFAGLHPLYSYLFVAGADGQVVCTSRPYRVAIDVSDRAFFRRALERSGFAVGTYDISRDDGKPIVVLARPVPGPDGEATAVVGLAAAPDAFAALLRDIELPPDSVATVIDSRGVIVAREPDPDKLIGQVIPEVEAFRDLAGAGREFILKAGWLDRVQRVAAIVPVEGSAGDLHVRVGIPTRIAQDAALQAMRNNLLLVGLTTLLVLIVGWFAAQRLVLRRMHELTATARRLGAGDLSARCSLPPAADELGELARTLDDMAAGIEESMSRLRTATDEVKLHNRAIQASRNGVLILGYGPQPVVVSANATLLALLETTSAYLVSASLDDLQLRGFDPAGWEQLATLVATRREGEVSLSLTRKSGEAIWLEVALSMFEGDGKDRDHAILEFRDITERRRHEEQLRDQAMYDPVTRLPNRNLLTDRLERLFSVPPGDDAMEFVLWLDVDRFQMVRGNFRREATDAALEAIARRLVGAATGCSTVAHMGRDEFVIIADQLTGRQEVVSVANRILQAVREPLEVEGEQLRLSASIGIAQRGGPGQDADSLLRNANIAMVRAKSRGGDDFCFYDPEMNARAAARLRIETGLQEAIDRGELHLAYQPKVDLLTGEVSGCEALCRWRSAEPGEFIPVAEESGLILPLGRWVLESACAQMRAWLDADIDCRRIAVNVSESQFLRETLADEVSGILTRHRLPPAVLMLELTESTVMRDPARALATMRRLKAIGVKLAIDAFGTGYSSLSALKHFPIDYLKIDRAFIADLTHDPSAAAIAVSIVSLAHSLNLRVIAVGVETEGQMRYLRGRGCDEMQGFHYARPLPPEALAAMVAARQRLALPPQADLPERTLLLVDDEPSVRSALRRILRREGYTLLFAGSAAEALELLASNSVGVVISDFRMPGMDGVKFLDKVRMLYPQTVRLVLSGYADVTMITDAINRGAIFRFLHKPWEDRDLLEAARAAFERFERDMVAA